MNAKDYAGREYGPGKFEGTAGATEYYYDLMLGGDGEDITPEQLDGVESWTMFEVDGEEGEVFSCEGLEAGVLVVLGEDNYGFVHLWSFEDHEELEREMGRYLGV